MRILIDNGNTPAAPRPYIGHYGRPGPTGLPLEIYCFSAKQRWIDYENVQSDLFDHVYAVMPLFNLRAFQYSGEVAAQEQ